MNLNLFIAKSGFASRRKADVLIKSGKVAVNGKIALEPWFEVGAKDFVKVGSRPVRLEEKIYLVFNKPKGVTTTVEDKFAERKIVDFVPRSLGRVYPVGRLDRFSRGLIILTNDGDLCYQLTHPRFEVEKEYQVWIKGEIDEKSLKALKKGVEEGGQILKVKSAAVENSTQKESLVRVIVSEGKKRHIRRLFETLGFSVRDLQRIRIGRLMLGRLKEGEFKRIDRDTIYKLTTNK